MQESIVQDYNCQVDKINELIARKKDKVEGGELDAEVAEVHMLLVQRYRYEKPISKLCEEYKETLNQLASLEIQKENAKNRLKGFTRETLSKYQDGINHYIGIFGADFRIVDKESSFVGRAYEPSIEYKIKIGNVSIPLGDADTPYSQPCFKNTLSDGDKSTLAFAFFMARLDMDDAIAEKVIVFDDPINSLDIHRRKATNQEIIKKANAAKQVIILTHDPVFAKAIYDSFDRSQIKCLCVRKQTPQESSISEWDIIAETATEYFISYRNLENYIENSSGDILSVARSIRPVVEGHLRNSFPTVFCESMWLGDFIREIDNPSGKSLLKSLRGKPLQELMDINGYSKEFHHTSFNPTTISPTELRTYAERTIKFLGR